jgi:HPt (histidine-containing phosphotransfer) domain-containing protein
MERHVLLDFRQVNDADLAILREELPHGDAERLLQLAHRIKGAARTIGAERLAQACERLEQAARAAASSEARQAFASLEEEAMHLNAHIDRITTGEGRTTGA